MMLRTTPFSRLLSRLVARFGVEPYGQLQLESITLWDAGWTTTTPSRSDIFVGSGWFAKSELGQLAMGAVAPRTPVLHHVPKCHPVDLVDLVRHKVPTRVVRGIATAMRWSFHAA